MKKYFGVKIIKAKKLNKARYNDFKNGGICLADPEERDESGYLVGYSNAEGEFNGPLDGGCHYISWSPRDVFESAYNAFEGLTFGYATEAAKKRLKVGRKGWNGKGMYVVIMPGYPGGVPVDESTAKIHNVPVGTVMKIRPYWVLYTAQGDCAMWAPSGSDSLAEDWEIVE